MKKITRKYTISKLFAQKNRVPYSFVAITKAKTSRALYLIGHMSTDNTTCIHCHRTLTLHNKISKITGYCLRCTKHFFKLPINKNNRHFLTQFMIESKFEIEVPLKQILKREKTDEKVDDYFNPEDYGIETCEHCNKCIVHDGYKYCPECGKKL